MPKRGRRSRSRRALSAYIERGATTWSPCAQSASTAPLIGRHPARRGARVLGPLERGELRLERLDRRVAPAAVDVRVVLPLEGAGGLARAREPEGARQDDGDVERVAWSGRGRRPRGRRAVARAAARASSCDCVGEAVVDHGLHEVSRARACGSFERVMPDDSSKPGSRPNRGAPLRTKPFDDDSNSLREALQRELRKSVAPSLAVILGPDVGTRVVLDRSVDMGRDPACELPLARRERVVASRPRRGPGQRRLGARRPRQHQRDDARRPAVRGRHPGARQPHLPRQDGHRDAAGRPAGRAGRGGRAPHLDRRAERPLGEAPLRRAARVEPRGGRWRGRCRRSASSSWTWTA